MEKSKSKMAATDIKSFCYISTPKYIENYYHFMFLK